MNSIRLTLLTLFLVSCGSAGSKNSDVQNDPACTSFQANWHDLDSRNCPIYDQRVIGTWSQGQTCSASFTFDGVDVQSLTLRADKTCEAVDKAGIYQSAGCRWSTSREKSEISISFRYNEWLASNQGHLTSSDYGITSTSLRIGDCVFTRVE